ncbi:hypothetical protein [Alteromonas gilva]|uniref:Uncharacterized protein n=1 Tax=Alteromonas gilva TaxID=2987522 RepID=A0ABT5KXJ8_9ALTE|nr:hypothetical protein [Alteromonas gilva]MDC8829363.1 hypothetical protein [Alteromonas gilva]
MGMLTLFLLIVVCANVVCIGCYRKYKSPFEKVAFYSGIIGIVALPVNIVGLFLGATNIQGVHGDLSIFLLVFIVWAATAIISVVANINLIIRKVKS